MKKITLLLGIILLSANTFAVTNASSLKITVYGVAVSLTKDCANPIVIFDSTTGTEIDFVSGPTIGGGDIADGTYQCVMINMSDIIKYKPSANDGANCVAGTEYSGGVCNGGGGESTELRSGTTFGANAACNSSNTVEDRVTLYLQTGTTRTNGGGAFRKPTSTSDSTYGFQLGSPFVIAGASSGTFVVDTTGKVDGSSSPCGMNAPLFSFR